MYRNISDGNLFRSWQLRSVIYTVFKQIKRKASTTTVSIKLEEMYNCFLLRQPYKTRQHSEKYRHQCCPIPCFVVLFV